MVLVPICCCASLLLARAPAIPSAGTRLSFWLGCSLALSGARWLLCLDIVLSGGQGCVLLLLCTQHICTSDTETNRQTQTGARWYRCMLTHACAQRRLHTDRQTDRHTKDGTDRHRVAHRNKARLSRQRDMQQHSIMCIAQPFASVTGQANTNSLCAWISTLTAPCAHQQPLCQSTSLWTWALEEGEADQCHLANPQQDHHPPCRCSDPASLHHAC